MMEGGGPGQAGQGAGDHYLPPLPPRPARHKQEEKNFCQNLVSLWTKIPAQLQRPVKVLLVVLGCVLALVIAFLVGYDTAKSQYNVPRTDGAGVAPAPAPAEELDTPGSGGGPCSGGSTPAPGDCARYYACAGGVAQLRRCPAHHHYDAGRGACVWIHLSSCDGGAAAGPAPAPAPASDLPPTLAMVRAEEARLAQGHLATLRKRLATLPSAQVELVRPGRAANPANTQLVESIVTEEDWEFLFPQRHAAYTYTNFLRAVSAFPGVCHPDSAATCRAVLATMFAHFAQETGAHNPSGGVPQWRQGLHYVEELGCDAHDCGYSKNCGGGEWTAKAWPCGKLESGEWQRYHGRGAKQLSYNYNYGQFSAAMFGSGNTRKLLDAPDLVRDTWLNLASAIWFFATPQPPKPSMLAVLEGDWVATAADKLRGLRPGFGLTTNIINGGIECGKGTETEQARNRAAYFRQFAAHLAVPVTGELGCGRMKSFADSSAVGVHWEQDWATPYHCKLVTYQTPYSALVAGDYVRCVRDKFKLDI